MTSELTRIGVTRRAEPSVSVRVTLEGGQVVEIPGGSHIEERPYGYDVVFDGDVRMEDGDTLSTTLTFDLDGGGGGGGVATAR